MKVVDPRLFRRARVARVAFAADLLLGLAAALLILAEAVLLARVAAGGFEGAALADLAPSLALLVAAIAGRAAASWGFEVVGRRAAGGVLSQLRLELVDDCLRGRGADPDAPAGAELATVAVTGVDALEGWFARYLPQVVLAAIVPVAVLALVTPLDPISGAIMLLTLPLVPVFMWLVGRETERRTRERWQALSLLAGHFLDVVRGLPTLRAFNRGAGQAERVAATSEEYRRATMGTLRVAFLSGAVLELAATLGIALVAVTVGVRLVEGAIAFEPALTVLVLAPELYLPLRNLAAQYHASADGVAVADRLIDRVERRAAEASPGALRAPSPASAAVRLTAVSFAYPGRPGPVLDGAELELRPGETVALTGPTGAGKSTIASLVLGLLRPGAGRVTVGELDLAECDRPAWLREVAWVPQRPTLFRGTIAANIGLGDPDAGAGRVRAAAKLAAADGFIAALPDGYETVVGDGARRLSAGEAQRIALARAFLREASLIVLDEPTANLDPAATTRVGEAIERLGADRTVLLITHRAEIAAIADRTVRLAGGRVAGCPVPA